MGRPRRPYSLHTRPRSKKNPRPVWYAQFRDETGQYSSAVSTGCTRHDDAVRWCEQQLKRQGERREAITFATYVKGFWDQNAPFATDRAAHGRGVSNGYLDIAEGYTRNHLLPVWGKERLRDLSAKRLDAWLVELFRSGELAPATINKLLQTLRTILERAVLDGWIEENPADHVKSIRVPSLNRSILSPTEALRLLATPKPWSDFRHYAINVLAATTGIRMGEVRALLVENVKPDHVEIRRSWEQGYGPRPPKADSVRDVPISPKVSAILFKVIEEAQPTGLMFYGRSDMDTPMSKGVIEHHLKRALCIIGIPVAEQARRHLTFHAWRHFLNSMLRSHGVADVKTRRITGHRTEAMTDWYTDWKALDISEVVSIQTALLEPPGLAATG